MVFTHDVIVIGGGAAGLTAAGGCAMFGLQVALIEGGRMGGECLNNGCVPSKALIAAAARAKAARAGDRFGVIMAPPAVNWTGVHRHIHDTIAAIAPHDSQERFEELGCEVIRGRARIVGRRSVEVGSRTLRAPRIVIATGSRPAIPPIGGIADIPYLTNENLFELTERPGHLVIVGGGAVGMEMAQAFRRLGSEVTVINPGRLMSRDDPESVAVVASVMREEGVEFIDDRAVSAACTDAGITVTLESGPQISGTHLLIAAGRTANICSLGLRGIGVQTGENGIIVDARRRTSLRNIYAIGDCRDGPRLTHVAGHEGSNVALEIATGIPAKLNFTALPWCTYTDPEVAQIGMTEAHARRQHPGGIRIVQECFDANDRAIAEGETGGHIKLVMKGRAILGVSIVGKNAGELLLPFCQTITGKSSSFALGSAIVSYPTRSEISKAAAFTAWKPVIFGSLPKKYARAVAALRRKLS